MKRDKKNKDMKKNLLYMFLTALLMLSGSCSDDNENIAPDFSMLLDGTEINALDFNYTASKKIIQLKANTEWTISSDQDWCVLSNRSGDSIRSNNDYYLVIQVTANEGTTVRTAAITMNSGGKTKQVIVTQNAYDPSSRPEDMRHTAPQLMKLINMGWNIGNTMDALGGETGWGNPVITRELIQAYKSQGINAIRLPCAWDLHADENGNIDASWMARVKEVVDYIVDENMYVIINIHYDGGWLETHCGTTYMTESEINAVDAKMKNYWTQIGTTFRDYDEHVIFAGANEPNVETEAQMKNLARYEQTFVNAVRATGGNNQYRVLAIQGPSTDMTKTLSLMTMPVDSTPESLVLEVHFYSPWWFSVNVSDAYLTNPANEPNLTWFWGKNYIQYGSHDAMQEEQILALFQQMKAKFVDQSIPVIVGECGTDRRECPNATWPSVDFYQHFLDSRAYYHRFIVENMKDYGMTPFIWDTGKWINRNDYTVTDSQTVTAVMEGAAAGTYPY